MNVTVAKRFHSPANLKKCHNDTRNTQHAHTYVKTAPATFSLWDWFCTIYLYPVTILYIFPTLLYLLSSLHGTQHWSHVVNRPQKCTVQYEERIIIALKHIQQTWLWLTSVYLVIMSFSDFQWCLVVCCAVEKDILSLYYRSNCKELELEFKSAYRQRRKQNQANRITLCYRLLPACFSILFPFSLQLFSLLPRYEFLPLSLHLHLLLSLSLSVCLSLSRRLSPTRPWRHFAFTSHYTVWDDESAAYLSVSIQCCSCLQVRRRRTLYTQTHTHTCTHSPVNPISYQTDAHTHTHTHLSLSVLQLAR